MSRRTQFRQANGRFRTTDLERDLGLRAEVCKHCNGFNAYGRNEEDPFKWDKPANCRHCGNPFDVAAANQGVT